MLPRGFASPVVSRKTTYLTFKYYNNNNNIMDELKVDARTMFCPHCTYEWTPRVENPKKCPKCQKWLPTPTYDMRFVPLDANGKLKKGSPSVGDKRGYENGAIVQLPLEKRWETWWELADEDDVPEDELDQDQKKRDEFMVEAEASAAIRAKELDVDEARTRGRRV